MSSTSELQAVSQSCTFNPIHNKYYRNFTSQRGQYLFQEKCARQNTISYILWCCRAALAYTSYLQTRLKHLCLVQIPAKLGLYIGKNLAIQHKSRYRGYHTIYCYILKYCKQGSKVQFFSILFQENCQYTEDTTITSVKFCFFLVQSEYHSNSFCAIAVVG